MYKKKLAEQNIIIKGGARMGEILDTLLTMAKPGVSVGDIDKHAERLIRKAGGVSAFKGYRSRPIDPPFPSTICASVNHEVVHGIATHDKMLKNGDIFTIDIGMRWPGEHGLYTDTAATIAVGSISEEAHTLLDATREALEVGIKQVKTGNTIADIGRAIQEYIEPFGYGIVRDLVGHSVGHELHEDPRVPNYYDKDVERWLIEPGVVLAIEPMITLGSHRVETARDGWTIITADRSLSAHFEHTVVVTDTETVVATRRPSER